MLSFWIEHGVKIFRVDNPHTKPLAFWQWIIRDIQGAHPDVIFFAEAFTRPKRMKSLAKLGFTMSYTYFTWKNSALELREYLEELTHSPVVEYFRGNLFANTPDILNEYLVKGGRPAFRVRLLLAGTLLPSYGIYSGFELCENVPVREGSEEYLDSENTRSALATIAPGKHQRRHSSAEHGAARAACAPAVRQPLVPHERESDDSLLSEGGARRGRAMAGARAGCHSAEDRDATGGRCGAGRRGESAGDILVAVNTDPANVQEGIVHVPIEDMGIDDDEPYVVHDLLTGERYTWRGARNYVRLDPAERPGHVLLVERRMVSSRVIQSPR